MHTKGCKCMTCAGDRYQKAETLARTKDPDVYFFLQRKEDRLNVELKSVQDDLKETKKDKNDLVMSYYNEANYE